jgi:hypothetical protein
LEKFLLHIEVQENTRSVLGNFVAPLFFPDLFFRGLFINVVVVLVLILLLFITIEFLFRSRHHLTLFILVVSSFLFNQGLELVSVSATELRSKGAFQFGLAQEELRLSLDFFLAVWFCPFPGIQARPTPQSNEFGESVQWQGIFYWNVVQPVVVLD